MTFGHSIVDRRAIIRAVSGHRRQVSIDLIEQLRHLGNVADIIRRQFHSDGLAYLTHFRAVTPSWAIGKPVTLVFSDPLARPDRDRRRRLDRQFDRGRWRDDVVRGIAAGRCLRPARSRILLHRIVLMRKAASRATF
jgi:hypothetical protein